MLKILFVDDEPGLVDVGVKMLTALGYEPNSYTDPSKALAAFLSTPGSFNMVITDQKMPGMSGCELAVQILEMRPDIPILICSGYDDEMTREHYIKLGIRGFLPKPVSMAGLSKSLDGIFSSKTRNM
jgi:DNA-binding NtrC family response regulator